MKIDYNAMTEDEKIAVVGRKGYVIQFIKNPSEAVQMAAVSHYAPAVEYIKNPSEAVCMAAVNQNGCAIWHIKNPSKEVRIAAVKSKPEAVDYLPEPLPNTVAATFLLYHPFYPDAPREIMGRAHEILEAHCPGLGDVYILGLSMNMTRDELSRTMIEWDESHRGTVAGAEMSL